MFDYNRYRFDDTITAVKKFYSVLPGKKWLDLGCHNGSFAALLISYGLEVTGVDVWPQSLKTDKTWNYIECDLNAGKLPLDDCAIDVCSALEFIEHVIDTDRLLDEVYRVLKPGGIFVVTTPNICMLKNRFRVPFGCYPYGLEYKNVVFHVRLYNLKCLISQLKKHGFYILKSRGINLLPQRLLGVKLFRKLSEALARAFPALCSNLFVIAKRA